MTNNPSNSNSTDQACSGKSVRDEVRVVGKNSPVDHPHRPHHPHSAGSAIDNPVGKETTSSTNSDLLAPMVEAVEETTSSTSSDLPVVKFTNNLSFDVIVYDSFDNDPEQESNTSYYGTLTKLGVVKASSSASITPLHPVSVFLVTSEEQGVPIYRYSWLEDESSNDYTITENDDKAMLDSFSFVREIVGNPNSSLATAFNKVWNDSDSSGSSLIQNVDDFFQQTDDYKNCTFTTYMTALTYVDRQLNNLDQKQMSLKSLVEHLGGTWPSEIPDIEISNVYTEVKGPTLDIWADLDLTTTAQRSQAWANLATIVNQETILMNIAINPMETSLTCYLDTLSVPGGDFKPSLSLKNPQVILSIQPLFKFVVLKMVILHLTYSEPLSISRHRW